ncbi:hypothetical protein ACFIOY_30380 [Bradyrhizobium sp. TZ2]
MKAQAVGSDLPALRAEHMDLHDDTIDELSGAGTIIIGGEEAGAVYYWLTIVPVAGPVVAEGSITGSEEFMRKVMNATGPQLVLQDGPVVTLQCGRRRYGRSMGESSCGLWSDRTMQGWERCPASP